MVLVKVRWKTFRAKREYSGDLEIIRSKIQHRRKILSIKLGDTSDQGY